MKKTIAAFDFDNTITTRDTLLPFLYGITPCRHNVMNSLKLLPTGIGYKWGLIPNHEAKEHVLTTYLKGYSYEKLQHHANTFAKNKLVQWLRPQALARIHWHQKQGHECIIISAGLEIYLQPWATSLGFNYTLATRIQIHANQVTGKIDGKNCFGQEKVNRLLAMTGSKDNFILYAYGDSRGDRELLALADYPYYRQFPT
jgi:phosphatidylglycerophosphatase C